MNTSAIWVGLIRTLTVVATLNTWTAAVAGDLAIIGERGQVLLYSPSGGTGTLVTAVEWAPRRRPIAESFFAPSEQRLFVSDDTGKLYELDLSAVSTGYQRIDTERDLVSCAVWYDSKEKRPAWLHLKDKESATHVRFRGKDNTLRTCQSHDIEFKNGFVFGMHIDGCWKSTTSLVERHPELAFLTKKYPNDQWIIMGRSKNVVAYGRNIAELTKIGEPFKETVLFHDRKKGRWQVQQLDESCEVTVFDDVAVIRGICNIKGDKHPKTGNEIQGKPSGKWYFYVPKENLFLSYELDPTWVVQYATVNEAFVSGNGKILRLRLGDRNHKEPEALIDLPSAFSVFAICPY